MVYYDILVKTLVDIILHLRIMVNSITRMGNKEKTTNTLDLPPKSPKNTTTTGVKTPPITSNTSLQQPTTNLDEIKFQLHQKTSGTHPDAFISAPFRQNFAMRAPPVNSTCPKTLRTVSMSSNSIVNSTQNSINFNFSQPGIYQATQARIYISHYEKTLR